MEAIEIQMRRADCLEREAEKEPIGAFTGVATLNK